jgi:hypothetical protein
MTRTLIIILASLILVGCGGKEEYVSCYSTTDNKKISFSINDGTKKINLFERSKTNIKIEIYDKVKIHFTIKSEVMDTNKKSHNPKRYFTENYILDRIKGTLTWHIDDSYDVNKPGIIPEYSFYVCNKVENKI